MSEFHTHVHKAFELRAKTLAAVRRAASDTNYGRLILSRFGEPEPEPVPASPEM